MTSQITILPSGNYLICDLCYTDDWDEILSSVKSLSKSNHGTLSDGRQYWFSRTAYGDGSYKDQYGNTYYVDAGIIGCIKVKDDVKLNSGMGNTFKMEQRFECYYEDGKICINGVIIDTDPSYSDDEEEDNLDGGTF